MAKHNNPSIAQDAARILNSTGEFLSDEVEGPVAVIPIQRCANIVRSGNTTSSSATVFTTPSDKDFYLTSAEFTIAKDATCDIASGASPIMTCVIDGVTQTLLRFAVITLQAHTDSVSISLRTPIKLDRNTAVAVARSGTAAGTCSLAATISGYTVETTR